MTKQLFAKIFLLLCIALLREDSPATARILEQYPEITTSNANQLRQIAKLGWGGGVEADFAWSPDGNSLAVVHLGGIWVYNLTNLATPIYKLEGSSLKARHAVFSHDGELLATAGLDNDVRIWNAKNGQAIVTLRGHTKEINRIVFSPTNNTLASLSADETVRIWDAEIGILLSTVQATATRRSGYGIDDAIPPLTFSPDGKLLLFNEGKSEDDTFVVVWNVESGSEIVKITEPVWFASAIEFSHDGKLLAMNSENGLVWLWDTANWSAQPRYFYTEVIWSRNITFSHDDNLIAAGADLSKVYVWNVKTQAQIPNSDGSLNAESARSMLKIDHHIMDVYDLAFSNDNSILVTTENTVHLWDSRSSEELITLTEHYDEVKRIKFSPDGTILASASSDGTVRLWAVTSKKPANVISSSTDLPVISKENAASISQIDVLGNGKLTSVAWSADGKFLAVASATGIFLYDTAAFDVTPRRFSVGYRINDVAFSPDSSLLASASEDGTVRLWNVLTGIEYGIWRRHSARVTSVAFSPDGKRLVSGSDYPDRTVRVWDVMDGKELFNLVPQGVYWSDVGARVVDVGVSSDGETIAAAVAPYHWESASSSYVETWDMFTGEKGATIKTYTSISALAFSPVGHTVAATGADGQTVVTWDVQSSPSNANAIPPDVENTLFESVRYSPDGNILAIGQGSLSRVDFMLSNVELRDALSLERITLLEENEGKVVDLAFSPDSKQLAVAGSLGRVYIWDVATRKQQRVISIDKTGSIGNVVFSPDSSKLATYEDSTANYGYGIGYTRVWDLKTNQQLPLDLEDKRTTVGLAFSADSSTLLTICCNAILHYWDLTTGRETATYETGYDYAYDLAIDNNKNLIAIAGTKGEVLRDSPKGLRFWDFTSHEETANWQTEEYFTYIAYSHDGQYILAQGYDLYIWNTATTFEMRKLHLEGSQRAIFSPDNQHIVASGYDPDSDPHPALDRCDQMIAGCNISVWSLQTGQRTAEYRGHRGQVSTIAFSPDGSLLASSASDDTIRIRDVETGEELAVWTQYGVTSIAFSPDGRLLASAGEDGVVRLWGIRD